VLKRGRRRYPQAIASTVPYNPNGCFDWWGYTTPSYACKLGEQIAGVSRMVSGLVGPAWTV
jgi:hypothetical protein